MQHADRHFRPPTEYIPPVQEPYDFIIFRASEVKDLSVDEPAQRPRTVHDDPAVVGVSRRVPFPPPDEIIRMLYTVRERKNPCGSFRCLPSDLVTPFFNVSNLADASTLGQFPGPQTSSYPLYKNHMPTSSFVLQK